MADNATGNFLLKIGKFFQSEASVKNNWERNQAEHSCIKWERQLTFGRKLCDSKIKHATYMGE